MLAISSSEALVSSSEAACSLAPSAKDWLDEEICPLAEATWSEPSEREDAVPERTCTMLRVIIHAAPTPKTKAIIRPKIKVVEAVAKLDAASSVALLAPVSCAAAVLFASTSTLSAASARCFAMSSRLSHPTKKRSIFAL